MSDTETPQKPFRVRRWHHRRDVRFVSIVAAFLIVFFGYGYFTGPEKITGELMAKIDQGEKRVDIEIKSRFAPESFHMSIYQDVGRVRGSEGQITTLYRVLPADVAMLSRKYWVVEIRPAPKTN